MRCDRCKREIEGKEVKILIRGLFEEDRVFHLCRKCAWEIWEKIMFDGGRGEER